MSAAHKHGHGHGPGCGQDAHALLEGALVLSRSWRREARPPVPAAALEDRVAAGLRRIAVLLAQDGVVLGHVKALLRCGADGVALSVTRTEAVDRTPLGHWPPAAPAAEWTLTVDVLYLVRAAAVDAPLLDHLFAGDFPER